MWFRQVSLMSWRKSALCAAILAHTAVRQENPHWPAVVGVLISSCLAQRDCSAAILSTLQACTSTRSSEFRVCVVMAGPVCGASPHVVLVCRNTSHPLFLQETRSRQCNRFTTRHCAHSGRVPASTKGATASCRTAAFLQSTIQPNANQE